MARQGRINWRYHTVGGRLLGFKVEHAPDQSPHGKAALCEGGVQVEPHTQAEHSSSGGNEPGFAFAWIEYSGFVAGSCHNTCGLLPKSRRRCARQAARHHRTNDQIVCLLPRGYRVDGAFLPKCVRARGRWRPGPGLATCRSNLQVHFSYSAADQLLDHGVRRTPCIEEGRKDENLNALIVARRRCRSPPPGMRGPDLSVPQRSPEVGADILRA